MERSRSYSGGWNTRPKPPRIATVKPVSKSFSEDDLLKASEISPRVFSRLKVQDLSLLKKDSLIDELEKCLEELEEEHGTTEQLSQVYEKVETERNQLLQELDIAFEDLQDYMQKQKDIEEQKMVVETDREELVRENEYLKAVLSSRNEIQTTQLEERNKQLEERVKELEKKNTELVDEINELYEDRQTLIGSLLNLRSEQVDDVIKRRSRSSSVASRESLDDRASLDSTILESKLKDFDEQEHIKKMNGTESAKKIVNEAQEGFHTEINEVNKEVDRMKVEYENLEKKYAQKNEEYNKLLEDRNEKNLNLSKLNMEKRTLQRQLDHMRESNRSSAGKAALLTAENESLKGKFQEQDSIIQNNQKILDKAIQEVVSEYEDELSSMQSSCDELSANKKLLEEELKSCRKSLENSKKSFVTNDSCNVDNKKLTSEITSLKSTVEDMTKNVEELRTRNTNLNTQCGNYKSDCHRLRNENIEFRNTTENLRKENASLSQENAKLKLDYRVIEKQMNNRINTLDLEISRLTTINKQVERRLQLKEVSEKNFKETCDNLLRQKEASQITVKSNEEEVSNSQKPQVDVEEALGNSQRKADVIKKENDRLLLKCRQLEKSVIEMSELTSEVKRLKETNEMLLHRVRNLQNGNENVVQSKDQKTSEREKYSALLVKYDHLCSKYDNICKLKESSEFTVKKTELENKELLEKNKSLQTKVTELKNTAITNKQEEQKILQAENEKMKNNIEQFNSKFLNLKCEKSHLETRLQAIAKNFKEMKDNKDNVEKDYQYILKSHKEEAQAELANKQNRIEQERDAIKTKYDLLRVEHDKCEKEKTHYKKTIESLREESNKLGGEVQKYRLMSNSTQDLKIQQLRDDNDGLERTVEHLQDTVNKTNSEKKALIERINRAEEGVAMTIRSLKARKNELQLQVETLKHDNEDLRFRLNAKTEHDVTRTIRSPDVSFNYNVIEGADNLQSAHSKVAELELENREYSRKLRESEGLMYDLQQALAHANDLAMQKALEGTKMKRNLEKKIDKITTDNTELRRKLYFTNKEAGEVSPNSLFPTSPVPERKSELDSKQQRKTSLPVEIAKHLDNTDLSSFINCTNIFSYQDSRLSLSQDSSRINSVPESPRLTASKQIENDLSQQLRELLNFTSELPSLEEEAVKKSRPVSEESIAPPVPPLPANYEVTTKELSAKDNDNIDKILASLSKVASELGDDDAKTKKLEHWV